MNKKSKIALLSVIVVAILVVLMFFPGLFKRNVSIAAYVEPITAVAYYDIVNSELGTSTYAAVKFYSGTDEISDYIAIPHENIFRDPSGKYGVSIFALGTAQIHYIAEVTSLLATEETRTYLDENSVSILGSGRLAAGEACFTRDSNEYYARIVGCELEFYLPLTWPISENDNDEDIIDEGDVVLLEDLTPEELVEYGFVDSTTTDTVNVPNTGRLYFTPKIHDRLPETINFDSLLIFGPRLK